MARRISSRTTDLIAISVLVVAGLGMGGRLIEWWSRDPSEDLSATQMADSVTGSLLGWGTAETPLTLQFGETPYALQRQMVEGTRQTASVELIGICRRIAVSAHRPEKPPDEAEKKLLGYVQTLTPTEEQPGVWQVFQVDAPVVLVVGIRSFPRPSVPPGRESGAKRAAAISRRVVCWGLAFPAREKAWTLYMFDQVPQATASQSGFPAVLLPAGARRTLSVRQAEGGALIGFEGEGPPLSWVRFFDSWFEKNGWKRQQSWSFSQTTWNARFRFSGDDRASGWAFVQFSRTEQGTLSGVLSITVRQSEL